MRKLILGRTGDAWAAAAPALCVAHCLSAPLLATFAPAFATNPAFEQLFMATALALLVPPLTAGRRVHGRNGPALLALGGGVLWALHLALDTPTLLAGGFALSASLLLSRRLRLRRAACDCPVCDRDP